MVNLLLFIVLAIPRIEGAEHLWMNGLYVALCILFVFPFIVYVGASGEVKGKYSSKICKFLGDISYPIYIIHYPLIYMFVAWVSNNHITLKQSFPVAILILVAAASIAYGCVKLHDEPVRRWLTKRFMSKPAR